MRGFFGGAERARTADLLVANEALSRLSYSPISVLKQSLSYRKPGILSRKEKEKQRFHGPRGPMKPHLAGNPPPPEPSEWLITDSDRLKGLPFFVRADAGAAESR